MSDLSWLDHPALEDINPKKLVILTKLVEDAKGKPLEKCIPLLMNTNKSLKSNNLSFTKDENNLIVELLTKDMSSADKKKFEMLKNMVINKKM